MNLNIAGKWTFNDVNKNQNLLKDDTLWWTNIAMENHHS